MVITEATRTFGSRCTGAVTSRSQAPAANTATSANPTVARERSTRIPRVTCARTWRMSLPSWANPSLTAHRRQAGLLWLHDSHRGHTIVPVAGRREDVTSRYRLV